VAKEWIESRRTVAIDFNGVLDQYVGWLGPDHFYPPRPDVGRFLGKLKEKGYTIVVMTANDVDKVKEWLEKNDLMKYISEVTDKKVPALVYVDDRAIRFQGDFDITLSKIIHFKTFWETKEHHEGGAL
jgi:adenylylsulfate kinase